MLKWITCIDAHRPEHLCDALRGWPGDRGSNVEESPDSQKQRCRVTPGRGNPTESATEIKPLHPMQ